MQVPILDSSQSASIAIPIVRKSSKLISYGICTLLVLTIFFCPDATAQPSRLVEKTDSIKMGVIDFLISEKALESGKSFKDYDDRLYIYEILNQTVLGTVPVGVYRFGTHTSQTKEYILIRDYAYYKILDTEQLGTTIKMVTDFLLEKKYSTIQIGEYTQAILTIYESNKG